jgi:hypothetical protein
LVWRILIKIEGPTCLSAQRAVLAIVYVVDEVAFDKRTIRINNCSFTILQSPRPVTLVYSSITEVHFTITISLIIIVITLVNIATLPIELSVAMLPIAHIFSLVSMPSDIILIFLPYALTML